MNQPGLAAQTKAKPYLESLQYTLYCRHLDRLLYQKLLMNFKRAVGRMCSTLT